MEGGDPEHSGCLGRLFLGCLKCLVTVLPSLTSFWLCMISRGDPNSSAHVADRETEARSSGATGLRAAEQGWRPFGSISVGVWGKIKHRWWINKAVRSVLLYPADIRCPQSNPGGRGKRVQAESCLWSSRVGALLFDPLIKSLPTWVGWRLEGLRGHMAFLKVARLGRPWCEIG